MKNFLRGFALLMTILGVFLYILYSSVIQQYYIDISVYSILMFSILSILLHFFLKKSVSSPNKQLFLSITLGNMLIKMIFSACLLLIYNKLTQPPDTKFILPFLIIYLGFTIFETWFMVKLSDEKP